MKKIFIFGLVFIFLISFASGETFTKPSIGISYYNLFDTTDLWQSNNIVNPSGAISNLDYPDFYITGSGYPNSMYFNGVNMYVYLQNHNYQSGMATAFYSKGEFALSSESSTSVNNRMSIWVSCSGSTVYLLSRSRDGGYAGGYYKYRSKDISSIYDCSDWNSVIINLVDANNYNLYINGNYISNSGFTISASSGTLNNWGGYLTFGRYDYNGGVFL